MDWLFAKGLTRLPLFDLQAGSGRVRRLFNPGHRQDGEQKQQPVDSKEQDIPQPGNGRDVHGEKIRDRAPDVGTHRPGPCPSQVGDAQVAPRFSL